MASPTSPRKLHLYTSIHSSCAARIHTALYLKSIPVTTTNVSLSPSSGWPPSSITSLNPSAKVPFLVIASPDSTGNEKTTILTQSLAILEYLEETFPSSRRLLPSVQEWAKRSKVRELVSLICADIQPPTNQGSVQLINQLSTDLASSFLPASTSLPPFTPSNPSPGKLFAIQVFASGLAAYDALISDCAGRFSVDDEVTLADVCLVPTVMMAEAYGADLRGDGRFRRVMKVFDECMGMWEFREGARRDGEEKSHPSGLEDSSEAK